MRFSRHFLAFLPCAIALEVTTVPARASGSETNTERAVTTVSALDIERYSGLWYEIARIPNRFQEKCARETTAEYQLRGDGRITVVNRCRKKDGSVSEARGVAKIVDTTSNAKLKVSFVSFLGWRPFWGDYWVIGLDESYQWAVIGTPDREYGWVLARSPALDEEIMEEIFTIIEGNGYKRDAFEMSDR